MKHIISLGAGDSWGFNCGPGALCAVLNMTPAELRPLMGDFERKGYTNPRLMFEILRRTETLHKQTYRGDSPVGFLPMAFGLVRVQWGGPWTKPGVPMVARQRHTHWVAMREHNHDVFDVNAVCSGGWIDFEEWHDKLVPWLCRRCCPKWDSTFWPTHCIEIDRIDLGLTD